MMPSSPSHPSSEYQRSATARSSVHGVSRVSGPGRKTPGSSGTASAPIRAAIAARRARRSDSGSCCRSSSPSRSRSNRNNVVGISAASLVTRDAAGCSRSCSSSKDSVPPSRTSTSSPSATNVPASSRSSISTTSGKNRIIGRSSRLTNDTSPSTVTRHRNPSHLGSYVHPSPIGSVVSSFASIGPLPRTVRLAIALHALPLLPEALPRVVVDLERLLRRAVVRRDVTKVHADPCPGRAPAPHRIDHHVGGLEVRHDLRVPRLPAIETIKRLSLRRRARDLDERRRRPAAAGRTAPLAGRRGRHVAAALRRLHPRWLVGGLLVVRRPRRIAQPGGVVALGEVEQRSDRSGRLVHAGPWIADRREPLWHRGHRERGRIAPRDLVPGDRRRDTRVGRRADGIRRRDRPVLRVLVVVEEDAVALLLPPLAGRDGGLATLDLARNGDRRAPHLTERPPGLEARVDVEPARTRGLG